jgi:hypothetical protein
MYKSSVHAYKNFVVVIDFFTDVENRLSELVLLLAGCDKKFNKATINLDEETLTKSSATKEILIKFVIKSKNYPYDEIKTYLLPLAYYWFSDEELSITVSNLIKKQEDAKEKFLIQQADLQKQHQYEQYLQLKKMFEGNNETN